MVFTILMWWVGLQLSAPVWFFWVLGGLGALQIGSLLGKFYKLGKESINEK